MIFKEGLRLRATTFPLGGEEELEFIFLEGVRGLLEYLLENTSLLEYKWNSTRHKREKLSERSVETK